jgi:hypothetical protein
LETVATESCVAAFWQKINSLSALKSSIGTCGSVTGISAGGTVAVAIDKQRR